MNIQGNSAWLATFDEESYNMMNVRNHATPRDYVKDEVLCAVLKEGLVAHFETRKDFKAGEYAKEAFAKFKKCRVLFYLRNEQDCWREIHWKNRNIGTLYRRPRFAPIPREKVPPELQVAVMCL